MGNSKEALPFFSSSSSSWASDAFVSMLVTDTAMFSQLIHWEQNLKAQSLLTQNRRYGCSQMDGSAGLSQGSFMHLCSGMRWQGQFWSSWCKETLLASPLLQKLSCNLDLSPHVVGHLSAGQPRPFAGGRSQHTSAGVSVLLTSFYLS